MRSPEPARTVDLTNCDREPIHIIGSVQSFGVLLAVDPDRWTVTRASRNAVGWFGATAEKLAGRALDSILSREATAAVRDGLQSARYADGLARAFAVEMSHGQFCDLAVHVSGGELVVEIEPSAADAGVNAGALVSAMMARLGRARELRDFHRVAAQEMRHLTGFDRVMVYRFALDGSGEVVAEAARAGLESFLGLHYPASDIPQQARRLYERNWLRLIADVDAEPSPVEPELDAQGRPLDLTLSVLRSVSPIHIEYLRNMGVRASMSVSILREGRLWGLFACHHYAPHRVPFERRTAAELFGQMASLMLESREREHEAAYDARARSLHDRLVVDMAAEATRFDTVVAHLDEIADLLACDGVGLWSEDRATLRGLTPNAEQFAALVAHLNGRDIPAVAATDCIAREHPPAADWSDRAAGMLVVPLSKPTRDWLVFFRPEISRTVNWAGDPTKPMGVGPLGDRLTPRKSFELWRETVRGRSQPWTASDVRIAESLRVGLLEVILRLSDLAEAERRRGRERQELLIAELNHRVRNILALIVGLIAQSKDPDLTVEQFVAVIGGRIQALARAHEHITADNWGPAPLRTLVDTEAAAYLGKGGDRIRLTGPEVLLDPKAFTTVALAIHELFTNAAKYGSLSDSRGRVDIEASLDPVGRLVVRWTESGGPPVQPPERRGFGGTVIERSIPYELGGEVKVEYALAGVRAVLVVPARHVTVPKAAEPAGEPAPAPAREPAAKPPPADVLLVEDNMIIAMDGEQGLRRLGVPSVRVAASVGQALAEIDRRPPSFALLDVNLGLETCFGIAERLADLNVPFVFASGYGEQIAFPERFAAVPRLRKPYTREMLRKALPQQ